MLKREIGNVKLSSLSAVVLRDLVDRRVKAGAGGVTIAGDLSFLSAVLKWGKHARQLDLPHTLALEARASLKHHRGHDLRHRATAQFFRMGLDIPPVALLTGHKTWTMLRGTQI